MNYTIYINGITLEGDYAAQSLDVEGIDKLLQAITEGSNTEKDQTLGVVAGVEKEDIGSAGWGIIFAEDDPDIKGVREALKPLIDLRQEQARKRFRIFDGNPNPGYVKSNTMKSDTQDFLNKSGQNAAAPANPKRCDTENCVPYYLLLVGSPDKIPYSFQSGLDLEYAVGRIHFDTLEEYAQYAKSVVTSETSQAALAHTAAFFGVGNHISGTEDFEPATKNALESLVGPLVKKLTTSEEYQGWTIDTCRGTDATKEALRQYLGGSKTPALLFITSHGLDVAASKDPKPSLTQYQGALICADHTHQTPVDVQKSVFAGTDLQNGSNLLGRIAFFNACFGAGTPQFDAYSRLMNKLQVRQPGQRLQLTPQPFVADLPRKMLSAPGGGALAVISHIERTWTATFLEDGILEPQTDVFESVLYEIMHGSPVGAAMEYLNSRHRTLSAQLLPLLDVFKINNQSDLLNFCTRWMAAIDAQWYTIVGDPAVRLRV